MYEILAAVVVVAAWAYFTGYIQSTSEKIIATYQQVRADFQSTYTKAESLIKLSRQLQHPIADNDQSIEIKISDNGTACTIEYTSMARRYTVVLPHKREETIRMATCQYFACFHDADKDDIEILHPPGVPLLVTAEHMGVDYIKIVDGVSGNFITYTGSDIPGFFPELIAGE